MEEIDRARYGEREQSFHAPSRSATLPEPPRMCAPIWKLSKSHSFLVSIETHYIDMTD